MRIRAKPSAFLQALGKHCKRLREQRGYSIDRLAKESGRLSTSVIQRLETGAGAVTVVTLFHYASALDVELKSLFEFSYEINSEKKTKIEVLPALDPRVKTEAYRNLLPFYSLAAVAGKFGKAEEVTPLGWIEVRGHGPLQSGMFIARAVGDSMEPQIHDGDYLVFRENPEGSRQGKIVLAQYRGLADPETGGGFTVKRYSSLKVASADGEFTHKQVTLSPLNPDYEPIQLRPSDEGDFRIVGEYLFTL